MRHNDSVPVQLAPSETYCRYCGRLVAFARSMEQSIELLKAHFEVCGEREGDER